MHTNQQCFFFFSPSPAGALLLFPLKHAWRYISLPAIPNVTIAAITDDGHFLACGHLPQIAVHFLYRPTTSLYFFCSLDASWYLLILPSSCITKPWVFMQGCAYPYLSPSPCLAQYELVLLCCSSFLPI